MYLLHFVHFSTTPKPHQGYFIIGFLQLQNFSLLISSIVRFFPLYKYLVVIVFFISIIQL